MAANLTFKANLVPQADSSYNLGSSNLKWNIFGNVTGNADTATKLGTSNVGSGTQPMYLSAGVATASTSTVGSGTKPIYLSSGTLTVSSSTVGSASLPVYLSSGTITSCTASSIFSAFSLSTNTLSITVAGQTRTANAVSAVSNAWTAGTTAGPKLSTTVNGVTGTAVAIPSASASASGIVTTDTQSFAGSKTFTGDSFEIHADTIRLRNKANGNSQSPNNPYVTALKIGDGDYVAISEYNDDDMLIRGSTILLTTRQSMTNTSIVYSNTKTYTVGTYVWYNQEYYRCTTAIETAEEWTAEHWTKMPMTGIMCDATVIPWLNITYNLGTPTYKWNTVYANSFDGPATKLGTATLGSTTKPIYLSSGTATECSTYAGGTAVTLNGTSKAASTASFYAPTGAGTANYFLKSAGSGAPTWAQPVKYGSSLPSSGDFTGQVFILTT